MSGTYGQASECHENNDKAALADFQLQSCILIYMATHPVESSPCPYSSLAGVAPAV